MPERVVAPHDGVGARARRDDIQALRGLAIALVILHHAGFPFITGGFLGVDIFFVISGFLMAGLIEEAIEDGSFGFRSFYSRRVRRLLPAAYATLVVTALIAMVLVDSYEYDHLVGQLGGSFGLVANVVLWRQTDYFGSSAALKPLLHMWSLSVEEQFYLVLPALLLMSPSRFRLHLVALIMIGSALLCGYFVQRSPSAAFYFLPTRAWELGVGVVTALLVRRNLVSGPLWPRLRAACVAALVVVPLVADDRGHPGSAAVAVCVATAVLMTPAPPLRKNTAIAALAWLGNRSYSLYLVHWPVFAFASHVFITPVPAQFNALMLAACAVWAELQYRLIEQRFRGLPLNRRSVAFFVLTPFAVCSLGAFWARHTATADTFARSGNQGFSSECNIGDQFVPSAACRSRPDPQTLVWGDSNAMHLVDGLAESLSGGVLQATRTVCGPFLGLAPVGGALYGRPWAESCVRFNESVVDYLEAHPEIVNVVLSSALAQYIPGAESRGWRTLVQEGGTFRETPQNLELIRGALSRTAASVRAMGKRVVLFAPPPSVDFNIGRCLERTAAGLPTLSPYPDCTFSRDDYRARRGAILGFLAGLETEVGVPVISLEPFLCRSGTCQTRVNGVVLYADSDHLSRPGSTFLGRQMNWGALVSLRAR